MSKIKIGLPRALMYYYYYPLWEKLFEELGFDVVVSDETNKHIVEYGIKTTVSELCFPIKVLNGHVGNLLEKGADKIFLPQFVRIKKSEWLCPKFLGLPTITKFSVQEAQEKLLVPMIKGNHDDTCQLKNYISLCDSLGVSKHQLKKALKVGEKYFSAYRNLCKEGYTIDQARDILKGREKPEALHPKDITIGLLGYVYNIYDPFISMNIIKRLRDMGVNVVTFEMYDEKEIENHKKGKGIFWTFARKLYNTGNLMINDDKIDGIIHLTAFACGPDSVIGKLLEGDCSKGGKPFMTIRVDEHTGEGHVQTRIEAFVDMLSRKVAVLEEVS